VLLLALIVGALFVPATAQAINPTVSFPDPALNTAVLNALGKASGPIYASDLTTLTILSAPSAGIHYLDGLEYCTALVNLSLYNNSIATITPLASCTGLQIVSLNQNSITDISPLSSATNLHWVNVGFNNISSISAFGSMANLQYVDVDNNPSLSDLSPLTGKANLRTLMAYNCALTSVAPLRGLQLQHLGIGQNSGLADVSALSTMTTLVDINAGYLPITDATPFSGLTSLTTLNLYNDSSLTDVSPLASLTQLEWLNLGSSSVSDISALTPLTNLTWLGIADTDVADLSAVSHFTKLNSLRASFLPNAYDISPLLAMNGTNKDKVDLIYDWLDLTPGSESWTIVQTLKLRGYEVDTDPQQSGGALLGTVHDSSGAVLSGVKVEIQNGPRTSTTTTGYAFGLVKPGTRTVTFTKPYYSSVTATFSVTWSETPTVDATLTPLQLTPNLTRSPKSSSLSYKRKHGVAKFTLGATLRDGRGYVGGARVYLQRLVGSKWVTVYRGRSSASGRVAATIKAKTRGTRYYRWYAPVTALDTAVTTSKQKVRIR
jgi:Leucine-rich repeat (LRR) protein